MPLRSHHVFYLLIALFLGLVTLLSGCIDEGDAAADGDASADACDCPPPLGTDDRPGEVPQGTTTVTAGE